MAKASVTITAEDKLSPGLLKAKKSVMSFEQTISSINKTLVNAFSFTAIIASTRKLVAELSACVQEYAEAEKVAKRVEAVWANVGDATGMTTKQLNDYSEALEKNTYFTSESIKEAGLLLAATESLNEEGFKRTLDLSVDLAAAMGTDVTSAAQTLAKAIQEPESALSRLKTIGVSFTEEEKEQIKALTEANKTYEAQNLILDKVEGKYKDVAKAINDTPVGTLDNIKDTLGDIRENLGGALLDVISPALETIYGWLTKISEWTGQNRANNKVINAARNGTGLYMFSTEELQSAMDEIWNRISNASGAEAELWASTGKTPWDDVLQTLTTVLNERARLERWKTYSSTSGEAPSTSSPQATQLAEDALNAILKKYGNQSGTYKLGNLSADIDKVATLLETANDEDYTVLREILDYLYSQLPKSMGSFSKTFATGATEALVKAQIGTLGPSASMNIANGTIGLNALSSQAFLENAYDWIGKSNATSDFKLNGNFSNDFGLFGNKMDYTDTMSILGSDNILSLTKNDLSNVLNKYGKYSADYQMKLLDEEIETVTALLASTDGEMNTYLNQILGTLLEQKYANENGEGSEGGVEAELMKRFGPILATTEQMDSFNGNVTSSFFNNMGQAGEVAGKLATNMSTMGPLLGAIATALEYVFQGLHDSLGPALDEMMNAVIIPLVEVGKSIGRTLLPIIKTITPILTTLGKVIVGVSAVFEWVGQLLTHWAASFVNAFTWITGFSMYDPGSPGNIVSFVESRVDDFNNSVSGASGETSSTGTAISSAQYRGATSVTINIYQEAPVVGDNGMRQFAQMIRDEFNALDYYGVTT